MLFWPSSPAKSYRLCLTATWSWNLRIPDDVAGGSCWFDLRIVNGANTSTVQSNVNLCTTTTVTYH